MVRVEKQDVVTTIILDRPEVRNAVDRATAEALADAFRSFEADADARVAVLWARTEPFARVQISSISTTACATMETVRWASHA